MCGGIVVDAGRSRSTNLGRDAYLWSLPGYHHNYLKLYKLPNSNLFTHRFLFFSREATSETYGPRVFFLIYLLCDLFYLLFLFRSIKPKIQKYFAALYFICDLLFQSITTFSRLRTVSGAVTRKGLTTPLTRRVASGCYLCAGAVYVVLLGSPTGSITLASYLREIPIAAMLHHPFLFGEIPT